MLPFSDSQVSASHIHFLVNIAHMPSQVLLGLSGVLLVMLSVLGSVGFFSAVGVKSTLIIMEVIPFLVLAVSSIPKHARTTLLHVFDIL